MGVNGPYYVDSAKQFPYGLVMLGEITKAREFDKSKKQDERRQERDRDTGLPLWRCTCADMDPDAWEKTFEVKIAAEAQPVAPGLTANGPTRLVQLEGVRINTYPKVTGRTPDGKDIVKSAYVVTATGIAPVKSAGAEGPKAA